MAATRKPEKSRRNETEREEEFSEAKNKRVSIVMPQTLFESGEKLARAQGRCFSSMVRYLIMRASAKPELLNAQPVEMAEAVNGKH